LDLSGLNLAQGAPEELLRVDIDGWLDAIPSIRKHFEQFGDRLPEELDRELVRMEERLKAAKK
jgi:phosphoenolpyruvate carboxykinase (GTP)